LVALRYRTRALIDFVRRAFRVVHLSALEERFDGLLTSFADGLSAVSSAGQMLTLLLITAAIWTTEAGSIWGLAGACRVPEVGRGRLSDSGFGPDDSRRAGWLRHL
jgi:hypothetical protein